ncbi:DUF1045 domain-containing protein [Polaromonas sp. SM01]|uniref:DUF1045 domain-containing protein n=1 Tax=Polaromonas sp. SM01 TaxID=3085630 RepID=UPI0029819494|nr:DUF1045 domain-containing protein [Polaromonas sp. SM01]MDW5442413.1 DUF1045 domain-containing protein [Polaromonas sp. SM01]
MSVRYAIYFSPAKNTPWWNFGAHWLGRDEHDNTALPHPLVAGIPSTELASLTQTPRRYGFHATLKAPFHLAAEVDETGLITGLRTLAQTLKPVALGPLRVATLGNFVALIPHTIPGGLQALADACVTGLDHFRAPLLEADLRRRRTEQLDERETELLDLYGYPYVLERFRLHLTLTGPVDADTAQRVTQAVSTHIDRPNTDIPLLLDRLCLFVERYPGAPFQRIIDLRLQS